jgi:hypothetical protein
MLKDLNAFYDSVLRSTKFAASSRADDDAGAGSNVDITILLKTAGRLKRPNPLLLVQKFVQDGSLEKFGQQLNAVATDMDLANRVALLGVEEEQADVLVNAMQLVCLVLRKINRLC